MVTEYLQSLNLPALRKMLADLLADTVSSDFNDSWETRANFRHEVLRWCVRGSGGVSVQWEALEGCGGVGGRGRERYVLALWEHLTKGENTEWRDLIENRLGNWTIYRNSLFSWFLGRFNLSAALALKRWHERATWEAVFAPGLCLSLCGAATAVLAWSLYWQHRLSSSTTLFGALTSFIVLLVARLLTQLDFSSFVQMLLPRLGATVGIGYLTLALAPDLIRRIYRTGTDSDVWFPYVLAAALTMGCYAFTLLHVSRRVAPPLEKLQLHGRSLAVVAIGIGHATIGLTLLGPLLFDSLFLELSDVHPCPGQLILTAAVALSLGVALQLVWEEKSLTEPL